MKMKTNMKQLLAVLMMLALTLGLMAGCGGEKTESENSNEAKTVKIGILQLMEHPSQKTIRESII